VHCFSCENEKIPTNFWSVFLKRKDAGCDTEENVQMYLDGDTIVKTDQTVNVVGKARLQDLKDRGIKRSVCEVYGVKSTEEYHSYPYYNKTNKLVATKFRTTGKKFQWGAKGDPKKVTLFGQQAFPVGAGSSKYESVLTITEGELDAMAARQMFGNKYAFVSLPHGAGSAAKTLQNQEVYEYINSYDKIVLCLDNDEQGKKAVSVMAEMLDSKKVHIMSHLKGMKDANDYLLANKSTQFTKRWWAAEKYSPEDIILPTNTAFREEVLYGKQAISYTYPWECFNEKTRGIRMGEMVTVIADTGVGKSQVLRELEHYYATTTFGDGTEFKAGIIHIEETPRGAMIGLMSVELRERLHLKDKPVGPEKAGQVFEAEETEDVSEAVKAAYDKLSKRVAFYKEWGSNDTENIISKIRFFVKALGCKVVFLDHISMIVSDQRNLDERKALDEIATKLKSSTIEWDYNLHIVAHVNRQGEIRGTANIEKLSDMVIRLERDKNNEDDYIANTTKVTCEKNRYSGDTGTIGWLHYSKETGAMEEVPEPETFEDEG